MSAERKSRAVADCATSAATAQKTAPSRCRVVWFMVSPSVFWRTGCPGSGALLWRRVVDGHESAALELARNRIEFVRLGLDARREVFRVALRAEADLRVGERRPVGALVVRDGPHRREADAGRADAAQHQLGDVGVRQPGAEVAVVLRLGLAAADAQRDCLDAVLVPVHLAHQLAPGLGQAIET